MNTDFKKNELSVEIGNKQILSIALPISLAILVPQLNLLINSIFLGHLSREALGNAGVTGVFYLIFAVAGHGMNSAMQSVFSGYAGNDKPELFKTVLSQGVRISLQLAFVFVLFTWIFAPLILKNVADPLTYPQEISFLKIRILGLPFLFLFQMGNAFLISTLNSRLLIIGFLFEALINVLFDYLFIFGKFGFPQMGFNGAATASVIAEFSGMIAVFCVIHFSGLKNKFKLFSTFQYNKEVSKKIIRIAFPLILQFIISLSTWFVFFLLIETRGSMEKAISNTMRNVFGIAGIFIWAFAGTCNNMVANLIGQGKSEWVIPVVKRISLWSLGFCLLIVLFLNIQPAFFFSLFGQDQTFVEVGIPVIRIVSLGMIFMSVSNVWLNAVTGTGETKVSLAIEIITISLYLAYTFYFMRFNYISLVMAWSNEFVYWTSILLLTSGYMFSKRWQKNTNNS